MLDFKINKISSTIFTPDLTIGNSLKMASVAADILGDTLDGQHSILPIPQDAPKDIPRIQLLSKNKKWVLTISLIRTDLSYQIQRINDEIIDIEKYSSISADFFGTFYKEFSLKIQRLAFVTERILPDETAYSIMDRFCKDEYKKEKRPFNSINAFEIHSLKKYPWEGFNINSWVRIKSGFFILEKSLPVMILLNDINTFSAQEDPDSDFSYEDIKRFFQKVPNHLFEILEKYFLKGD